ncbi:hypothetical protein BSKO_06566 [Bryopsis sp. KO-2023]|nr:hypothetical protein BSKO_06566 [Bryopsis sp. KO-2023]
MDCTLRWAIDIASWEPSESEFDYLLGLIPREDAQACVGFKFRADQKRALVSRLLQRSACVAALGVEFDHVVIKRTKGKKPFFAGTADKARCPNFNFNVSHEGDFVVLISEPLCLCGVDVAAPGQLRRKPGTSIRNALEAFRSQLTPHEWSSLEAAMSEEDMERTFQRHWSLKEAFVKARGDGLGFPLQSCEFRFPKGLWQNTATLYIDGSFQTRWRFHLEELRGGHWVSVARGPPEAAVDANKEFTATFQKPIIDEAILKEFLEVPNPTFKYLGISDIIPDNKKEAYMVLLQDK